MTTRPARVSPTRTRFIYCSRAQDGELGFFKGLVKTSGTSGTHDFDTKKPAVLPVKIVRFSIFRIYFS